MGIHSASTDGRQRRDWRALAAGLIVLCAIGLASCTDDFNVLLATKERVTFALVINTRVYNGLTVVANVRHDLDGPVIETVSGTMQDYPNTATGAWAQMTTLEKVWTNATYSLDFCIDVDGDSPFSSGDLEGIQHFDVTTNAVWSETSYFHENLTAVP